jgi:anti-sigma factor RsiW
MAYADGELDEPRRAEVEAWLATARDGRAKLAALGLVGALVREDAVDRAAAGEGIADAVMARLAQPAAAPSRPARERAPRAANDNVARIFTLAAAAVAVAAGLTIWARVEGSAPPVSHGAATGLPALTSQGAPPPTSSTPAVDGEPEVGATIAAVDFGSNAGSIFYVPSGVATTTVLWVAEDVAGEQQ